MSPQRIASLTKAATDLSLLRVWAIDVSMSVRNIARTRRRSILAMSAIGAGVIAIVLAGGFIEWTLWFGRESVIHSQLGHFRVFRPGYLESGFADPYRYLLPAQSAEFRALATMPHVEAVAPRLSFSGLASVGDTTLSFLGEGLDPVKERLLSRAVEIVEGNDLSADDEKGVVLGEGLASNLGAKPGDRIVLLVTSPTGGVNAIEAHVRGTFSTIMKAYGDSAIRLPITLANELTRSSGAHSWAVVLTDTDDLESVLESVRPKLDPKRYEIVPWIRLSDFYNKVSALYERQFGLIKLIIAAVIVLGITNTMMMSVLERTREIGTSLALGRRRSAILRAFVIEGALLGVIGGLSGLAIALILAHIISSIGIPMPPSPGMSHGFVAGIRVTAILAAESVGLVVASTLIASVYPAWRASRMNIVDSLRVGR